MISQIVHSPELKKALVPEGVPAHEPVTGDTEVIQGNLQALAEMTTPYDEKLQADRKAAHIERAKEYAKKVALAGAVVVGGLVMMNKIDDRMDADRTFQPVPGESQEMNPGMPEQVPTQPGE